MAGSGQIPRVDNRANRYLFFPADATTLELMKLYVDDNFNRISNSMDLMAQTNVPFLGVDPERYTDGMMIRANGVITATNPDGWSPDGDIGTYVYWSNPDNLDPPVPKWERLASTFTLTHYGMTGKNRKDI